MRPTERFAGASDFAFLVEDVGRAVAASILGLEEEELVARLGGGWEAPQAFCMALYPWSSWYLQRVDADQRTQVETLYACLRAMEGQLGEARRALVAATRAVGYGAANEPLFRSLSGVGAPSVWSRPPGLLSEPPSGLDREATAKLPSDSSDGRGLIGVAV